MINAPEALTTASRDRGPAMATEYAIPKTRFALDRFVAPWAI